LSKNSLKYSARMHILRDNEHILAQNPKKKETFVQSYINSKRADDLTDVLTGRIAWFREDTTLTRTTIQSAFIDHAHVSFLTP